MQTVLLDTDYVIDFLRGKSSVQTSISSLLLKNNAYLSVLSVYELYAGIELVTEEVAKMAGLYRFRYRKKGISLSVVDCIIAETARSHHHVVATNNKKHYPESAFWSF
jgi:predicted nucleic acid-binding protein